MSIETEVDSTFERVRSAYRSQVIDELERAHSARVVIEVSVWCCLIQERERKGLIGKRCCKAKEKFAETEDSFIGQSRSRRPAPINSEVLRSARSVNEVWCVRKY